MITGDPVIMTMEELYSYLRKDIKKYFKDNNRTITLCRIVSEEGRKHGRVSSNINPHQEYARYKKGLSRLCGWDAPKIKYDQRMYDFAIVYLTRSLGL